MSFSALKHECRIREGSKQAIKHASTQYDDDDEAQIQLGGGEQSMNCGVASGMETSDADSDDADECGAACEN